MNISVIDFEMLLEITRDRLLLEMESDLIDEGSKNFNFGLKCYPTAYDINNGMCDYFAEIICDLVPSAESLPAYYNDVDLQHIVIKWNNKFYDAECITGVDKICELPVWINRNKTRNEVLFPAEFK